MSFPVYCLESFFRFHVIVVFFSSSGRCSRVNYAIKNPKFHFIQMPNLLTIHLSETHVYYLLQNDCRSAQRLACISWTDAETLMSLPEGICQCSSLRHCIKFHPSLGICLKQRVHPRSFSSKINVHFCFEGLYGGGISGVDSNTNKRKSGDVTDRLKQDSS